MRYLLKTLLSIYLLITTVACGGGGGDIASSGEEGGGIGGTGLTSLGEITGFGSIFVNGIEFDTDNAEILVNGVAVGEEALGVGMVVTVEGVANADGDTGVAHRVMFDGAIRGPVAAVRVTDSVTEIEFRVLDVTVVADLGDTVFVGTTIEDVNQNDYVEISGFVGADGQLQATRVERISDFVPSESEITRQGVVSNLNGTSFDFGELVVDFAGADLSALSGGSVSNDLRIQVTGTLDNSVVTATTLSPAGDLRTDLEPDQRLVLEGVISNFDGTSTFRVGDVPVDASGAELLLTVDTLANGLLVEVAGRWDGQTLRANTVSSRQGEVLIAARLQAINPDRGTITLGLFNSSLTAIVSAVTLITDSTGEADRLRLTALAVDDYLTVEAIPRGSSLHALQVNRGNARANALRAALESFIPEAEVQLQGVSISTGQANLQDAAGEPLSAGAFYGQLEIGDELLVIDALEPDGTADTVRLTATD